MYIRFFFKGLEISMYMSKKNIQKKTSLVSHADIFVIQDTIWTNIFRYYPSSQKKNLKLEFQIFVFYFRFTRLEHLDQNRSTFAITVVRYFYVNMVCLYIKEIFIQPFPKVWNVVIAAKILKMPNF